MVSCFNEMAARRQAPGGNSSICFGTAEGVSAGDPQNAPHTRAPRQDLAAFPPAGSRAQNNSSNAFAQGHSQNEGNALTDRSTTRVRQAPGGMCSIMFGDENSPDDRFPHAKDQAAQQQLVPDNVPGRMSCAPGGTSRICLGEASPTKMSTAMSAAAFHATGPVKATTGTFAAGLGREGQKGGESSIQFGQAGTAIVTKKPAGEDNVEENELEDEFMQALDNLGRANDSKDQNEQAKENKGPLTNQLPPQETSAKKQTMPHMIKPTPAEPVAPRKLIAQYEQRSTTRAPPGGQSSVMFG